MLKKITISILAFALLTTIGGSTTMAETGEMAGATNASEVWRALQRIQTTATVLHTVAHPDDENGALLTWLSRGRGVRTGLYSTTRGEGGANLIGPELFDALGIVRTEEHLAAVRYYGIDLFFSSAVDFGYSKRLDETLEKWDYQMLLEDMVRIIRRYRPDVIISRFQGNRQDGHGHHQVSGVVTLEAFRAAGDPSQFPEHLADGLQPWQPKKLYISRSRWRRSETQTGDAPLLKIDMGEYNALLGLSYAQIARQGLSYQRSQGVGQTRASKGSSLTELRLVDTTLPKQAEPEQSLFDGLDTTIMGMAGLANAPDLNAAFAQFQESVDAARHDYDARYPWAIVPHLAAALKTARSLIEDVQSIDLEDATRAHLLFLLQNKEQELMGAANAALGCSLEVLVQPEGAQEGFFRSPETFTVAIPGQTFSIGMRMVNPSPVAAKLVDASLRTPEGWNVRQTPTNSDQKEGIIINANEPVSLTFEVEVPQDAAYTQPYWTRASEYHDAVYTLKRPEFRFLPFAPPEVHGVITYRVDGVDFTLARPAQTVSINRPWGERRRLLSVAPAISLSMSPRIGVVPISQSATADEETTFTATVEVLNNVKGEAEGTLALTLPDGWHSSPESASFDFTHEGASKTFTFDVSAAGVEAGGDYTIQAVATYNGEEYTTGYQAIDHTDLEPRHLYRPATMTLHGISIELPGEMEVGYIMGVGDRVPEALQQIGIDVQMLDREELRTGDLSRYDTILIGIRAYAVRQDLISYNGRLLDYVYNGGNLIVQYQTPEFDAAPFGPYPYTMGRRPEEVSEEDAQVSILMPENPIFQHPNQITEADFNGWVEERGSKFLTEWDANYQALLTCNDREQEPQHGGFLYAKYGQGTYTYAAYAFYRQLPAGVAGAYRLFINMLTLKP
ncbi:MAG: PIG-L family deacetylase [Candidatus Poribacteria bacterium]|nr:PIG-L family deacetylase [Candidatus Poribacteria bacterium]